MSTKGIVDILQKSVHMELIDVIKSLDQRYKKQLVPVFLPGDANHGKTVSN